MTASERGGVALGTVIGGLLLATAAVVVLAGATDLATAAARARTAADAAALAAAGASPLVGGDGDTCGGARRAADVNGARLRSCRVAAVPAAGTAEGSGVEVEVEVDPRVAFVARAAGPVPARAAAGIRPAP